MIKAFGGILLFVFFSLVFIVLLVGARVLGMIRRMRQQLRDAADRHARQYEDETGRQRQQYGQRRQRWGAYNDEEPSQSSSRGGQNGSRYDGTEYQSTTAAGETIIDRRERTTKKIFDDNEGEYVDFQEEA